MTYSIGTLQVLYGGHVRTCIIHCTVYAVFKYVSTTILKIFDLNCDCEVYYCRWPSNDLRTFDLRMNNATIIHSINFFSSCRQILGGGGHLI